MPVRHSYLILACFLASCQGVEGKCLSQSGISCITQYIITMWVVQAYLQLILTLYQLQLRLIRRDFSSISLGILALGCLIQLAVFVYSQLIFFIFLLSLAFFFTYRATGMLKFLSILLANSTIRLLSRPRLYIALHSYLVLLNSRYLATTTQLLGLTQPRIYILVLQNCLYITKPIVEDLVLFYTLLCPLRLGVSPILSLLLDVPFKAIVEARCSQS